MAAATPGHSKNGGASPVAFTTMTIAIGVISAVLFGVARFGTGHVLLHNFPLDQVSARVLGPSYSLYEEYLWLVTPYVTLTALVWKCRSDSSAARVAAVATAWVVAPALVYSGWHLTQPSSNTPYTVSFPMTISYIVSAILPLWQYVVLLLGAIVALSRVRERAGHALDLAEPIRAQEPLDQHMRPGDPSLHSAEEPESSLDARKPGLVFHGLIAGVVFVVLLGAIALAAILACCWTCGPSENLPILIGTLTTLGPFIAGAAHVSFFGTRGGKVGLLLLAWVVASTPYVGIIRVLFADPVDGQGSMGLALVIRGLWIVAWILAAVVAVVGWLGIPARNRRGSTVPVVMLEMALVAVLILLPDVVVP